MKRFLTLLVAIFCSVMAYSATDDYNARQAKYYTQEAEYYQKKAEGYRREAQYYLKKAEDYQKDAAYYTRKGNATKAKDYNHRSDRALDDYETQMRHAANADEKASDYLKRAARLLQK